MFSSEPARGLVLVCYSSEPAGLRGCGKYIVTVLIISRQEYLDDGDE